jgi:hypothetical protein
VAVVGDLLALIADLVDMEPCRFDHHGYCQAHGWLTGTAPCPHGRAQQLLAESVSGVCRECGGAHALYDGRWLVPHDRPDRGGECLGSRLTPAPAEVGGDGRG